MTRTELKHNELMNYLKQLKDNGFDVYYSPESNYANFVKNNKIGYVENGDYGFNFSTVHKPNHVCGTGFSIHRDIAETTIKHALDCLIFAPSWADRTSLENVKKYSSWEDYIKNPINKIVEKIKL